MDNKKRQNRRRRFEEEAYSSSVEDMTFISDYFTWCVYKLKRKKGKNNKKKSIMPM